MLIWKYFEFIANHKEENIIDIVVDFFPVSFMNF